MSHKLFFPIQSIKNKRGVSREVACLQQLIFVAPARTGGIRARRVLSRNKKKWKQLRLELGRHGPTAATARESR